MLVILFLRGAIPKVKLIEIWQMSTLVNISNISFSTFMPYYLTIFIFKNLQTIAGVDVYYLIYFLLNYEFGHINFLNPDLTSKFMLLIHYVLIENIYAATVFISAIGNCIVAYFTKKCHNLELKTCVPV